MKKLQSLVVCLAALMTAAFVMPASAQTKGEMSVGVSGGLATYNTGGMLNVFYQYSVIPHLRLAPEIGYVFRNEEKTGFEMSADLHFPFRLTRGLNIYPLCGLTMNSWHHAHDKSLLRFGADFGGGLEVYFTGNFKMNLQGKFSWMRDTSGGFISLGLAYVL